MDQASCALSSVQDDLSTNLPAPSRGYIQSCKILRDNNYYCFLSVVCVFQNPKTTPLKVRSLHHGEILFYQYIRSSLFFILVQNRNILCRLVRDINFQTTKSISTESDSSRNLPGGRLFFFLQLFRIHTLYSTADDLEVQATSCNIREYGNK